MAQSGSLRSWIEALPEHGRYVFTRAEAGAVADGTDSAIKMALYRLKRAGAIVSPRRDFYVVVPREYRSAGAPPATWFIDDLMRHLGRRYYVALLSAAALHGAGHQRPMAFQVITDAAERDIEVGRVRIDFHVSRRLAGAATQAMQTETGAMVVATPETTVFDLVRFPQASGSWGNVATVIAELADVLRPEALAAGAARVARADVQRLGWLLDFVGRPRLGDALVAALGAHRLATTPLTPNRDATGAAVDRRWRVLVNDDVEPDL